MKTRTLSSSSLEVSVLGLGLMGMSEFYGTSEDAQSIRTIQQTLDAGVNFLDTADMYGRGHNEELLGRALREWPGDRDDIVIATKFGIVRSSDGGFSGIDGSPNYVRQACEDSLRRLGVDTIDLYYQHRVDPDTPVEETVGAMAELVDQGKVRYIGLSEAAPKTIERAHSTHPITALQTEYSLWTRDVEAEILPLLNELNIALVAYSPLGRGMLTGAYKSENDFEPTDFRRMGPRFQGENLDRNLSLVAHLEDMAKQKNITPAQLALAWLLHQDSNVVPIPGTRRFERVQENLGALNVDFSQQELEALNEWFTPEKVAGERYPEYAMKAVNG